MIKESHFIANRLSNDNGYSWTLPSRVGAMLTEIETLLDGSKTHWKEKLAN